MCGKSRRTVSVKSSKWRRLIAWCIQCTVYTHIQYTVAPLLANFELWHEDILKTLLRGQSHEIRKSFIQKYHMG